MFRSKVNNIPAGLYFVSPGQVNAQIPWDVLPSSGSSGNVNVTVSRGSAGSQPEPVTIVPVAPAVFYLPESGGWAIAINSDGSLAAPENAIPGVATHPAGAGDGLQILATGLGAVDSPIANGAASLDKLRRTVVVPLVLIGGQSMPVAFSGLSPQFPGVNQVNITIPQGAPTGHAPSSAASGRNHQPGRGQSCAPLITRRCCPGVREALCAAESGNRNRSRSAAQGINPICAGADNSAGCVP